MPRRDKNSPPIYQVHIADGFSTDCDELVNRCLQLKTLDFKEFAKLWKEMNFDLLYEGRTSSAEVAELSEQLIHIAKHYMVKNTSFFEQRQRKKSSSLLTRLRSSTNRILNMFASKLDSPMLEHMIQVLESVTGLFLVYSLLQLQPFSGFAILRLVPNDVRAVNRIETVARRERRLDVLYILGEVLVKWTQYHADERPRGMEGVMRKYLEGYTSIDRMGVRPMGVFYRQNEELDHIRDLGSMTRQYMLAKKALFGEGINDPSLQYINENLPTDLNTSFRKLITGAIEDSDRQEHDASSEEEKKTAENRSRTLQAIKSKAMSSAVDPMNHLTSAENRKKSTTTTKSKSDLKKPTGKIKSGTHTRLITTSPKKAKTKKRKNNKRKSIGDLKDDSDDDVDLHMDDFDQITTDDDDDNNDTDKDDKEKEKKKPENRKQDESVELQNEQSIDIEIDSLPLILKPGDFGPDIEIEIIDQQIPKGKKTKPGTTSSGDISVKTSFPTTTATITTITTSSDEEEPLSVKSGVSFFKTYKRGRKEDIDELTDGFPLKKKEKRDLKRSEIKSRFAKLGLLPIGNFEEKVKEK